MRRGDHQGTMTTIIHQHYHHSSVATITFISTIIHHHHHQVKWVPATFPTQHHFQAKTVAYSQVITQIIVMSIVTLTHQPAFKVRGSKPRLHHPIDQHGSSEARESSVQQGWKSPSRPPLQVLLQLILDQDLRVSILRHSPPRLHSKGRGRSPVTLRIAPSEPFSPFKRFSNSSDRSNAMRRGEEMGMREGSSTDPRLVHNAGSPF